MICSSSSSDPILKVDRIYKSYASTAGETPILKNIDFDVKKGEIVAIVGPRVAVNLHLNISGILDRLTWRYLYQWCRCIFLNDHDMAYLRNNAIGFIFQSII